MSRTRILLILIILLTIVACGDDEVTVPPFGGKLAVVITGLPDGVSAPVTLTSPDGAVVELSASTTFDLLPPGAYTLRSQSTTAGFSDYYPGSAAVTIEVRGGEITEHTLTYVGVVTRGALHVVAGGLPDGAVASYDVTGPDGFTATVAGPDTLDSLRPGSYTVTGRQLTVADDIYRAWPESETVTVTAGQSTPAYLTYGAASDASLDLSVAAVELTQAVQREDGGVPMIAGRDGYLRIYGVASEANDAAPPVRVDWYEDGTFLRSDLVPASGTSTPTGVRRFDPTSSWNLPVAGELMTAGISYRVTIDPDGDVPEALESNNRYPDEGLADVDVVTRPALGVRLIPVLQSANGLQGDVTAANADDYVRATRLLMPVPSVDVDVRAVYTTSAPPLQANNGNGAWGQILSEILGLRQAEDHGGRHYYGVVRCDYGSGIAGLGRLPGYVAMGWDAPGSRHEVCAHELGHNLGLYHAPCGGPDAVDPDYPHAGGLIGAWGLDVTSGEVKDPSVHHDLMSYCRPKWISDYMYEQVLGTWDGKSAGSPVRRPCLLVWGHVTGGVLELSPALVVDAVPSRPEDAGPWHLTVRDASGRPVVATSFALPEIGDLPAGDGAFAWTIPMPPQKATSLATVEVSGPGQTRVLARSDAAKTGRPLAPPTLTRAADLRLAWDADTHPLVMVRRPGDGTVLAVLREGSATLVADPGPLDLIFSDGVQSERRRMIAP
ncbi:hypothetical protein GF314_03240 [bacterium]|nr:hypothetical protein [bacterium]